MVIDLMSQTGVVMNTKMLAERYLLPLEFLAKVLQMLAKSGILISKGGPRGGYMLARGAEEVTMAEVIEAVEGPIHLSRCEEEPCDQMQCCTVRLPLLQLEKDIVNYLKSITVAHLYRGGNGNISFGQGGEISRLGYPLHTENAGRPC